MRDVCYLFKGLGHGLPQWPRGFLFAFLGPVFTANKCSGYISRASFYRSGEFENQGYKWPKPILPLDSLPKSWGELDFGPLQNYYRKFGTNGNTKKNPSTHKNYFFRHHVSRDDFSPATRCAYLERTKIKFSSRKMLAKLRGGLPSLCAIYKIAIGYSLQVPFVDNFL